MAQAARAEQERFERAEKVEAVAYDVPCVYWEGHVGSMGDGYFADVEEVQDHCAARGIELPEYVWACEAKHPSTRADELVESALEEFHEDAASEVGPEAIRALDEFLEAWWDEQGITSYDARDDLAVIVPRAS